MSHEEPIVNPDEDIIAEAQEKQKEAERIKFAVYSADGDFLYRSNQEEFDEIVFNVCAFGAHSMQIPAHKGKIEFTFVTINEVDERAISKLISEYIKKETPSNKSLVRYEKIAYLAHQLQSVKVGNSVINYSEKPVKDRMALLDKMATQQTDYYAMYLWCFQDVIRRALVDEGALGNS